MPFKTLALAPALLLFSQVAFAASTPFPDMERSWYRYKEAVSFLKERGTIEGYPDGTFRPKDPINRAELLKIVFKGRSDSVPVQRRCFSDVNPDAWYAPYVCAGKRRGIVDGYPDGTYRAERTINVAEAMKILTNAYGWDLDEPEGEHWYSEFAKELDELHILPKHSYFPWTELNRERAADLLAKFLQFEETRKNPQLSPGCSTLPPKNVGETLEVDGRTREFLLTVPEDYVEHDPTPLVVAFHGRTNHNSQVRQYMDLDKEMKSWFIAYPQALRNGSSSFSWTGNGERGEGIRDIAFFDAIVEYLAEHYCIDMEQIFTVGHSLGGWMADTVACVRGDVVRGSAHVGGSSAKDSCSGPAASMIMHNPNDRLSSFGTAELTRAKRVESNACSWDTENTGPDYLSCVTHTGCEDNPLLWCPHTINHDWQGDYYPHTWPGKTAGHIREFFRLLP